MSGKDKKLPKTTSQDNFQSSKLPISAETTSSESPALDQVPTSRPNSNVSPPNGPAAAIARLMDNGIYSNRAIQRIAQGTQSTQKGQGSAGADPGSFRQAAAIQRQASPNQGDRIEVQADQVLGVAGANYYHMSIMAVINGQVIGIKGDPGDLNGNIQNGGAITDLVTAPIRAVGGIASAGRYIVTSHGPNLDYRPQNQRVVVATGQQAHNALARMLQVADQIKAKKLDYYVNSQNSNSVAYTILLKSGITPNKPDVWAPGWGLDLTTLPSGPRPVPNPQPAPLGAD